MNPEDKKYLSPHAWESVKIRNHFQQQNGIKSNSYILPNYISNICKILVETIKATEKHQCKFKRLKLIIKPHWKPSTAKLYMHPLTNSAVVLCRYNQFLFYEWEHRTGTMCPFSSLHPSRKRKGRLCQVTWWGDVRWKTPVILWTSRHTRGIIFIFLSTFFFIYFFLFFFIVY